jgi:soluble lytic murein transglycosylase-like protein
VLKALGITVAIVAGLVPSLPVLAGADVDAPISPHRYILRIQADELALEQSRTEAVQLRAQPILDTILGRLGRQVAIDDADYRYREAVRDEQSQVYALAADDDLAQQVAQLLPSAQGGAIRESIAGLHAIWRLAGITDPTLVRRRRGRGYEGSLPVDTLVGLYKEAGSRYGIDWTYLAAINFIESDFGRVNGPSSSGALGPMQFMPATWDSFGSGGDIWNPRDAIHAAARYLAASGAPGDMATAIWHYNQDYDYVAAVSHYAAALRSDSAWLNRYYYWSTSG